LNRLIFFGPPGAGKGTQAKIISDLLKIPHLSTGEILRRKIQEKDGLALELRKIMTSGKLISDEILNSIVSSRLKNFSDTGFILDGYPRTIMQYEFLNNFLENLSIKLNFIFNIEIDYDILKQRIIKRSSEEGREDDKIDILKTRHSEYTVNTRKVSELYRQSYSNIFYQIDGSLKIEEITTKIMEILKKSWKSAKFLISFLDYSHIYHVFTLIHFHWISLWLEYQVLTYLQIRK